MIADLMVGLTNEEFASAVEEIDVLVQAHSCRPETQELIACLKRIVERRSGELTLS